MKPGDIHWVQLPAANGREQAGRRPAIVLQDDTYGGGLPLVLVVPLTGASSAGRFAGTVRIEPTATNGLDQPSVALVFQMRALDRKRIQEQIGVISPDNVTSIFTILDRLTGRGVV